MCGVLFATAQTTTLTFTGRDANNQHIQLNRVVVANLTRSWQETIYYPDTILVMGSTGIEYFDNAKIFGLSQNVPNPFDGISDLCLSYPKGGEVNIEVVTLDGRRIAEYSNKLPAGIHTFRVLLNTPQSYVVTARSERESSTIKIVNNGNAGANALQYLGEGKQYPLTTQLKSEKGQSTFDFHFGDMMTYIGYAIVNGEEHASQMIQQQQMTSENFVLNFDVSAPFNCGTSTVTDHEGNVYNTVQIGNQCWMRENMRCTTSPSTGTNILEPSPNSYSFTGKKAYYPNDNATNVATYGLLYNWNAAVDTFNTAYGETNTNTSNLKAVNATFSGNRRGICPRGWHVPSDAEWTQLENYVSSQNEYVCNGIMIAKALASSTGWISSTNTCAVGNMTSTNNSTGFSAVPVGYYNGSFYDIGYYATFWSISQGSSYGAYYRYLYCYYGYVYRFNTNKSSGYSVRCLHD